MRVPEMLRTNAWFAVRVVLVLFGGLGGWATNEGEPSAEVYGPWWYSLALVPITGVMIVALLAVQAVNPWSAKVWQPPSWYANPFDFSQPLQFFHLAAWHFLAGGSVSILQAFVRTRPQLIPEALLVTAVGVGAWLGVRVSERVFKKRRPNDELLRTRPAQAMEPRR